MSKVEDKLFRDFYNFWRWEYTKRNDKFKREFKVAVELDDCAIQEGFICSNAFPLSHFIGDYKIDITYKPNKPAAGWMRYRLSSDDIVAKAFNGSLLHDYPQRIEFPSDMQYSMIYDELYDGLFKIKGMEHFKIDRENKNYYLCMIDFSKPLDKIVEDIEKLFNTLQYAASLINRTECINSSLRPKTNNGEIFRFPKDGDLPRAVGLWLWDYMSNNNIKYEHKYKARNAFRSRYQGYDSQKFFIDKYRKDSQLDNLFDITCRCIEEIKILPLG